MDNGAVQAALSRGSLRRAAHVVGAVVCVIAVVLLVRRGIVLGDALGDRLTRISPGAFAASFAVYAGGSILLGVAWASLVRIGAGEHTRARPLFVAHLRSQLAKYLPGNIFHLAYRHIAARRENVGHRALAAALALESVLVICAAAILSTGVASDPRLATLAPWAHDLVWAAPALAVLAWIGIGIVGRRAGMAQLAPGRTAPLLAAVLAIDLAFFLLASVALRLLCETPQALPFSAWCGWLSLGWALGYATPGAPAGIGLREAVLALGLAPVLGEAEALALALAYRLVTVIADASVAALGFALRTDADEQASEKS